MTGQPPSPRAVAVVLAGGTGTRMGTSTPKQLLKIAGTPMIERSIAAFDSSPDIDDVVVVMVPGWTGEVTKLVEGGGYRKVTRVLDGGANRSESTYRALHALVADGTGEHDPIVLLHDAARPLVDHRIIADCVAELRASQAVTVALPCSDTILVVRDGKLTDVPSRDNLHRAQTPQGFRLSVITDAYAHAKADPHFTATDDATVVMRYLPRVPVGVVPGSAHNIKITHPTDIPVAEALLASRVEGP